VHLQLVRLPTFGEAAVGKKADTTTIRL